MFFFLSFEQPVQHYPATTLQSWDLVTLHLEGLLYFERVAKYFRENVNRYSGIIKVSLHLCDKKMASLLSLEIKLFVENRPSIKE